MFNRGPLFVVLSVAAGISASIGCIQKLDDQASSGFTNVAVDPDGGAGARFPTMTTTPPIGIAADQSGDPTSTTTNACDKVEADSHTFRTNYCTTCHAPASGAGGLSDINNDAKIVNVTSTSGYLGQKYIDPGSPDTSLIYKRVLNGSMPPAGAQTHPTISDMSVLRAWIMCLGAAPPSTGTGGSTGATTGTGGATGSTTGAGGTTGTTTGAGGRTGTGGATGSTGVGGMTMNGIGGATGAAGATGGTDAGVAMSPCTGILNCNNPTAVAATLNTTVTARQACFEVDGTVTSLGCNNATGRTILVNGQTFMVVNGSCNGTLPAPRNGGFCIQANAAGGNQQQPPATTLNITL